MSKHAQTIQKQREAIRALHEAYDTADLALKKLHRRQDLFEGEKHAAERTIRATMHADIAAANRDLKAAQAEARKLAVRIAETPDQASIMRRAYHAQRARDEMEGQDPKAIVERLRQVVQAGDKEAAQEYASVARKFMQKADLPTRNEYGRLSQQAEPDEVRLARDWGKVCDAVERHILLSRTMSEKHIAERVGVIHPDVSDGLIPDPGLEGGRKLTLLADGLDGIAAKAVESINADSGDGGAEGGDAA